MMTAAFDPKNCWSEVEVLVRCRDTTRLSKAVGLVGSVKVSLPGYLKPDEKKALAKRISAYAQARLREALNTEPNMNAEVFEK